MSPFALPQLSLRWIHVWRRNFLVWRKLTIPSILGNLADPLLYMLGFGYGLGALVPQMNGTSYIAFIAAGFQPEVDTTYGRTVSRGVSWILKQADYSDGYIRADGSNMYGHALATELLARVELGSRAGLGQARRPLGRPHRQDLRDRLRRPHPPRPGAPAHRPLLT